MQLDLILNLGVDHVYAPAVGVKLAGDNVVLQDEDVAIGVEVGSIIQAVVFASYRFHRRTLLVHAINPETNEVACKILAQDKGRITDPSVALDFEVYRAFKEEERENV